MDQLLYCLIKVDFVHLLNYPNKQNLLFAPAKQAIKLQA